MSEFDPYYQWLAIPPEEQPPNHYRLLGVPLFTQDKQLLEVAYDQRMTYVRQRAVGKYIDHSQKLLDELARARRTLLDPKARAAYEQSLRDELDGSDEPLPPAPPVPIATTPRASPIPSGALSGAMKVPPPVPPAEPQRAKSPKPAVDAGRSAVPWLPVVGGGLVGIAVLMGFIAFVVVWRPSVTGPATKPDQPPTADLAPRIELPGNVRIPEGEEWVVPLRLVNVTAVETEWEFAFDGPVPDGCVITPPEEPTEDWTLSWTPEEEVGGGEPHVLQIQATGMDMSDVSLTTTCRVIVTEVDEPPVCAEVPKQVARQAEPWTLELESHDPDFPSQKLTYKVHDPPEGLVLDPETGVLRWTPDEAAAGKTHRVQVDLRDAGTAGHVVPVTIELEVLAPTRVDVLWRRDDGGASSEVVSTWVIEADRTPDEVSPPELRREHPGMRPIAVGAYRIVPDPDDPSEDRRYLVALRASSTAWRATPWGELSTESAPRNWLVDTIIAGGEADLVLEYQIAQATTVGLATYSSEAGLRQYLDRLGRGFRTERILQLADGQLLAVSRQIASEFPRDVVFLDQAATRDWANDTGLGTYEGKHPVWFARIGGPGNRKYAMILDTGLRASDWRFDLGVPLDKLSELTERRRGEAMVPVCLEVN